MKTSIIAILLIAIILLIYGQVMATPSAFWDSLNNQRMVFKSSPYYTKPRTHWEAPRHSRISTYKKNNPLCYVKSARYLPDYCVKKNSATRQGIISQINYLRSYSTYNKTFHYVSYNIGQKELLDTAKALLHWFDSYGSQSLADNFELHELDTRIGKVKYTGYFTPFISARRYPSHSYRYPIYAAPSGYLPTRREVFDGILRGKGLEIAWTNDPIGYYQAQVQGSGILSFENGDVVDLHFTAKTAKEFVSVARYMYRKGYISSPSSNAMRKWLENHPERIKEVLSVNPRFIFFSLAQYKNTRKTASVQPLIAGHTVAVDTSHIPFGSILLAEIPIRNNKGKIITKEWRLLFPQDRGGAIKGTTRLDIYTGEGLQAKRLTNAVTGVGRAYLLKRKSERSRLKITYRNE